MSVINSRKPITYLYLETKCNMIKNLIFLFYFYCRTNVDTKNDFENAIKRLTNNENDTVRPRTLIIMQRNLTFQRVCGQILDASFEELCDRVRLIRD